MKPTPNDNPFADALATVKGIGEQTVELLAVSGTTIIFDLLLHLPRAVLNEERALSLADLEDGQLYIVSGRVHQVKKSGFGKKQRFEAIIKDDHGQLHVVFFGPSVNYAANWLTLNKNVTLRGEVKKFLGKKQMVHPKSALDVDEAKPTNTLTEYSQTAKIKKAVFKKLIEKALAHVQRKGPFEHLAPDYLAQHRMNDLTQSFVCAHRPKEQAELLAPGDESLRRLAFEELLRFYLGILHKRKAARTGLAPDFSQKLHSKIYNIRLPFELTGAQARVYDEIASDMGRKKPMTRLIQGDVGSGKTAVSALSAVHALNHGFQVAVMAPTEILAEQLLKTYQSYLPEDIKIAFLTASTKASLRKELLFAIASGEVKVVVGTHALLTEDVVFSRLGLVIVDEQHRFGVKQRALLLERCHDTQGYSPHMLVMSATPIPRTLALTLYGDLDLSVIDERPKGRIPVHTQIFPGDVSASLMRLARRVMETEQKAFVVFPLVEESEFVDLKDATNSFEILQKEFGASVALLHGRMKAKEKADVMNAFRLGQIRILISTTVVEVGVDVPDATCMIIIHAERFGLAQLHQLRGRVGRKDLKSYCFLLSTVTYRTSPAYQRLQAMCDYDDGFRLAKIDLELRGAGEILGTKQAGVMNFKIFNHTDYDDLVAVCKNLASKIMDEGLTEAHGHLLSSGQAHYS